MKEQGARKLVGVSGILYASSYFRLKVKYGISISEWIFNILIIVSVYIYY